MRYIIGQDYWTGLRVVPIVMAAEMMMGIYFNLSFWYKLIDKTIWGAIFSGIGCAVLIAVNVIFVPKYGYMACAWGGFAGYGTAMLVSYFVGQRYYKIDYPLKDIAVYTLLAIGLLAAIHYGERLGFGFVGNLAFNTLCLCIFAGYMIKKEYTNIKNNVK